MKMELPGFARIVFGTVIAAMLMIPPSLAVAAPQPRPNSTGVQREAMRKLAFLAGDWSGPVIIIRGPGEPLHLTQSEYIRYELDGLVMLIEGKSTGADGKVQFQALATIAFDDASHTYRFRAYTDGHYIDAALTPLDRGFSWGFTAGPAHVVNTMRLTSKGEWHEVTEVAMGNNPPMHSVDMTLQRQP
jgi:hypothetical protein